MAIDKSIEQELVRFKRYREELVNAEASNVEHHVREFVREISRNTLIGRVRSRLPKLDVNAWWNEHVIAGRGPDARLETIPFPDDEGERLAVLLDLTESMGSGDRKLLSVSGFGGLFGRYKAADAAATAINLVFRPLAELLGDKIREEVHIANPAVRELAGVPLDRIPGDGETRIFLSHKSVDKDLVRPYSDALAELGLDPWLDDKDMKAGDSIHREIADGFDRSCAVVFFVTQNFKDERWLKREVDHAVNRKVERGDRFAIITLVFGGAAVPRPLQEMLYVSVTNEVHAMREILRALPVRLGPARWRG